MEHPVVDFILRPKTQKLRSLLEAKLRSKGVELRRETAFDRKISAIYLEHEANVYRREPNDHGEWPCSVCCVFKAATEYQSNASNPNGLANRCRLCSVDILRRSRAKQKLRKSSQTEVVLPPLPPGFICCQKCKTVKSVDEFSADRRHFSGLRRNCKLCLNTQRHSHQVSLSEWLQLLVKTARSKSHARELGEVTITTLDLISIYAEQRGRCYYSRVPLAWGCHTRFQISLERLDNHTGYILGNVRLCAVEFNTTDQTKFSNPLLVTGSSQWTQEKFSQAHWMYDPTYSTERHSWILTNLQQPSKIFKFKHYEEQSGIWICAKCGNSKPLVDFRQNCSICRICSWWEENTLVKFLKKIIQQMRKSSQMKNYEFNFTYENLKDLVISQNGLCAISRIPLTFRRLSNWQCSPERLNTRKGYIVGNVALICLEFNTSDHSHNSMVNPANVKATAQWTPELYMQVFWPNGVLPNPKDWVPPPEEDI